MVVVYSIINKKVRCAIVDRDKEEIIICWFNSVKGMKNFFKYKNPIYLRKYKNDIIKV